jgi:hypothetical protein
LKINSSEFYAHHYLRFRRVIVFTDDSAWTEHMPAVADGAHLFIAER